MSATDTGVEVKETRPLTNRQEMMKEISATRNKQFEEESGTKIEDLEPPETKEEAKKEEESQKEEPKEEVKQEQKEEVKELEKEDPVKAKKYIGKIDGKEVEFNEDQVVQAGMRTLQKESAADKRLEEASRLFREAQEMVSKAAERPSTDGAKQELTDDDLTEVVKSIQYGSEDEAKTAIKSLIGVAAKSGQSDQLTLNQVNEMLDFREARQWVETEYKDLLGDKYLKSVFLTREKELRSGGDNRPYREVYDEIGKELREWRNGMNPTTKSREEIKEKKSTIVNLQSASGKVSEPKIEKEPSPSDVIEKMRKARHQS